MLDLNKSGLASAFADHSERNTQTWGAFMEGFNTSQALMFLVSRPSAFKVLSSTLQIDCGSGKDGVKIKLTAALELYVRLRQCKMVFLGELGFTDVALC